MRRDLILLWVASAWLLGCDGGSGQACQVGPQACPDGEYCNQGICENDHRGADGGVESIDWLVSFTFSKTALVPDGEDTAELKIRVAERFTDRGYNGKIMVRLEPDDGAHMIPAQPFHDVEDGDASLKLQACPNQVRACPSGFSVHVSFPDAALESIAKSRFIDLIGISGPPVTGGGGGVVTPAGPVPPLDADEKADLEACNGSVYGGWAFVKNGNDRQDFSFGDESTVARNGGILEASNRSCGSWCDAPPPGAPPQMLATADFPLPWAAMREQAFNLGSAEQSFTMATLTLYANPEQPEADRLVLDPECNQKTDGWVGSLHAKHLKVLDNGLAEVATVFFRGTCGGTYVRGCLTAFRGALGGD